MRYIKQYNKTECGVVAIINAFKWSGFNISYKLAKGYLREITNYQPRIGIMPSDFKRALKHKKFPFKFIKTIELPTIEELKENYNKNRTIIIGIQLLNETSHLMLITKITNKYITLANFDGKVKTFTLENFEYLLYQWCIGYVIEKDLKNLKKYAKI